MKDIFQSIRFEFIGFEPNSKDRKSLNFFNKTYVV